MIRINSASNYKQKGSAVLISTAKVAADTANATAYMHPNFRDICY